MKLISAVLVYRNSALSTCNQLSENKGEEEGEAGLSARHLYWMSTSGGGSSALLQLKLFVFVSVCVMCITTRPQINVNRRKKEGNVLTTH